MIKRLLTIAIFFFVPMMTGPIFVQGVVVGCEGAQLTVLHQMDLEGTGCTDSNSSFTCTEVNSPNADCGSGTGNCPLDGDLSFRTLGGGNERLEKVDLTAITTGFVTLDFRWQVEVEENGGGANTWIGMMSAATNNDCRFRYHRNGPDEVDAQANSGTSSTDISVTIGNTYFVRLTYDMGTGSDDDCRIRVSATAYGATDIGNELASGSSSSGSIVGWSTSKPQTATHIFDDIMLCQGDAGTTEGHCGCRV